MRAASNPTNETDRLKALRSSFCAYAPREERFDRLTRLARQVTHAPIALVSIVEETEQWFRSAQGLPADATPRDVSFCAHAVASGRPLVVSDTWEDPAFFDNPLVTGDPGIRAYVGFPLEIARGVFAGTLCVIDTMPRRFSPDEMQGLFDLARLTESELRSSSLFRIHAALLERLSIAQRRDSIVPGLGCWTPSAFRRLVSLAMQEFRAGHSQVALCRINAKLSEHSGFSGASDPALCAEVIRHHLPPEASLTHLGENQFCILSLAATQAELARSLSPLRTGTLQLVGRDGGSLCVEVEMACVDAGEIGRTASANQFWAVALQAGKPLNSDLGAGEQAAQALPPAGLG